MTLGGITAQYFRLKARNWGFRETGYSQTFATSTLAQVPGDLVLTKVFRTSVTVILENPSVAGNPAAYTQFAIYDLTDDQWFQSPLVGVSALGSAPAWHTYAQWGGAAGVNGTGLTEDSIYAF